MKSILDDIEFIKLSQEIICFRRDLIEAFKLENYNPFDSQNREDFISFLNIKNQEDRILFQSKNEIPILESCLIHIKNEQIKSDCIELIQMHKKLISIYNNYAKN